MSDVRTDSGHVMVTGTTGAKAEHGGKTTLANWFHDQAVDTGHRDLSVFYNPKRHGFIRGNTVRTVSGFAKAYRAGARKIDFQPKSDYGDVEHEAVVQLLRRLPGRKQMFHDEAKFYADSDGLRWALSQGGNLDSGSIRSFVLTQHPWDLPEEFTNLVSWTVFVGKPTKESERYFQAMKLSHAAERLRELSDSGQFGAYHWAVFTGGELDDVYAPVDAAYAGE